ncbi:MAG: hypothetical protein ABI725_09225 [Chloroflexota bacterium]
MEDEGAGLRATLITAAPLALAIGVFGVVFGAAASATIDPLLVVAMSSGSADRQSSTSFTGSKASA